jgi:hypothetical protein
VGFVGLPIPKRDTVRADKGDLKIDKLIEAYIGDVNIKAQIGNRDITLRVGWVL